MICARCKEERPITHLVKSDIIADFVCEACVPPRPAGSNRPPS